jgi:hypothetical protein
VLPAQSEPQSRAIPGALQRKQERERRPCGNEAMSRLRKRSAVDHCARRTQDGLRGEIRQWIVDQPQADVRAA